MNVLAIDPGWNGAVAFFAQDNLHSTSNCPSSREPIDMVNIIKQYKTQETIVYIERVWSRPTREGHSHLGRTTASG